jgi:hypothetical protein
MKTACLIFSTLLWMLAAQAGGHAAPSSPSAGRRANAGAQSSGAAFIGNHRPGAQDGRNRVPVRKPITPRVAHLANRTGLPMQMPPAMHSAATPQSLRAPNGWANGGMVAPRAPAAVARRTGAQLLTSAHRRNANSPLIDGNMTTRREASAVIDGTAIHRRR